MKTSRFFNYSLKKIKEGLMTCLFITGFFIFSTSDIFGQCNQLIWSDDFNGAAVDLNKWQLTNGNGCPSLCGFGNGELETYKPENASIFKDGSGSYLNINVTYDAATNSYSSARLFSKNSSGLQTFKYGRIEARIKLPSALDVWPAFWMLPDPGNWPTTGEIDIMESKHKNPHEVGGTIHYDFGGHQYTGKSYISPTDLSTEFHTYAVEWSPNVIKWYVDNTVFHTATPNTTVGGAWPFNNGNFYIILNAAVGGPGTPYTGNVAPNPADYPTQMLVDYVRVYNGSYNYGVTGSSKVYNNATNKSYSISSISGASYNWTVPAGATIASGQGTNAIVVNWGSTGGDVSVTASVNCTGGTNTYKLSVVTEPLLPVEKIYEDFESNRFLTYGVYTGTFTQAIANPSPSGSNTSSLVGKYDRKPSELYDVLYVKNIAINNANDFVAGRKRVSIDIYTNAPIGSKITMQFENSKATTATNYPLGRHSSYSAFTTDQNKWQTLEFQFEKSIDAGTSIFSVDNVAFLFEPNSNSANTYYFDNILVRSAPEKPILITSVLENYDGTSLIKKGVSTGTYTPNIANPLPNSVNNSANVAKYIRNSAEQYDVLFFSTGSNIDDAGLFKDQTYKILVDVYSDAPIGTIVSLNMENSLTSKPTNFPTGRNSGYQAITTKQNQWETLTFYYSSTPDPGTSNLSVNQLVFLFNSGSYTSNTYYMDNIRIGKTKLPDTYSPSVTYEDYETIHNISYSSANGTYTPTIANPSASGINTSANVGKYIRNSAQLYDNISFVTSITDAGDFKKGIKKFAMDVYTSAPAGTIISWQLESSPSSIPSNYPTGRHSIYQAAVKQTNAWQTLIFTYASTPDAGTADADVNRFVMLFNPNSSTGDTYYIDNLRSLNVVSENSTGLPLPWLNADIGSVGSVGSASYSNNTFTIKGSGADIWGTNDAFQYVYQTLNGDGEISARVNSLGNTNTYAKAGVMFRESLTTDSKHAMTDITASSDVEFLSRNSTSGATNAAVTGGVSAPQWIKIVRSGNSFTSFYSVNGNTWNQLGSPTIISMASTLYVGLAVTSHSNGVLDTGIFDNVTVKKNVTNTNINLALAKPTITSSVENGGLLAINATDGNAATRWSSSWSSTSEWIYVDLQNTYNINKVVLKWEAAFAKQYQIQISNDTNWTGKTVYTQSSSPGGIENIVLSGSGRYVRIFCTQKALAPYGYSIFELEVYGSSSTARISSEHQKDGVKEDIENEINVYPNPSSDFVKINLSGNKGWKHLVLNDMTGRTILQKDLDTDLEENDLDIRNLRNGLYILTIKIGNKTWVRKIVKQ